MHDLVTEQSFDLEKTYEYILSIQVSLNGFSFSVMLPENEKLLAYKSHTIKISSIALLTRHFSEWFKTEEIIQKPFKKNRIIISNEFFSLVPDVFFQESLKSLFPQLLYDEKNSVELAENVIPKLNAKLIFALPDGFNETIQSNIGECEIIHPVKLILNHLPEIPNENGLVLFFDSKNFYTILFNKQEVLLVNNFKMAHETDVLYYVLSMLKQLNISTKATAIFITGLSEYKDEIENKLKNIFPNVSQLDSVINFSGTERTVPFLHHCNS